MNVILLFGKKHKHVLEAVRGGLHCSEWFKQSNLRPFRIKGLTGESTSHVMMTEDGFSFVVLGFTGRRAAQFKEAYYNEQFNRMEAELRARPAQRGPMQALRDPERLLPLLQDYAERNMALEHTVVGQTPKVESYEHPARAEGCPSRSKRLAIRLAATKSVPTL